MTKDCAHDRKAHHSMWKLEQSLRRLQTDYLDLWMLHEVVWEDDPDSYLAPGGSAESLLKAKEQGKVRFIGFTGHKHPDIHRRMLSQGFPFDAVLMPLNVFDAHHASFEREILADLPGAGHRGARHEEFCRWASLRERRVDHSQEALRYTMSLPVATVVSGTDSLAILEQRSRRRSWLHPA